MKVDKVFCINLESRPDRWEQCLQEFPKLGLEPSQVVKFNAVKHEDPIAGCTISHMEILRECRSKPYENILILEDDFEVINPFNLSDLDGIDPPDMAMLYLGSTLYHHTDPVSDKLVRLKGNTSGTHSYIINRSIFDYVLCHKWPWEEGKLKFPPTAHSKEKYIDKFYSKEIIKRFNCYHYVPLITAQRDSFSDILDRLVSYKHGAKQSFKKYVKLPT